MANDDDKPSSGKPSKRPKAAPKPRGKKASTESPSGEEAEPIEAEVVETDEDLEKLADAEAASEEAEASSEAEESPAGTKALAKPAEKPLPAPTSSMQQYMREVMRHPLLTREEEHALAVRYKETGDLDAAYRLVTANLRLVVKIAHEYHRSAFSLIDLVQEGNVGLMHAVKKFDPYRGVKLSSYSAWWIRAYILRYIMENWRIVKLGTTQAQRKLFFNLRKEQEKLAAQGFDPTPKLLAERLNVTEQDVTDMDQRLGQDEFSLDVPTTEDGKGSRLERLSSTAQPADERLGDEELKEILKKRLAEFGATLKDKEKYIFEHRLVAEEPMTLQQIGDQYGITRERARQIEAKLIRQLKEWMREAMPDFKELEVGAREE